MFRSSRFALISFSLRLKICAAVGHNLSLFSILYAKLRDILETSSTSLWLIGSLSSTPSPFSAAVISDVFFFPDSLFGNTMYKIIFFFRRISILRKSGIADRLLPYLDCHLIFLLQSLVKYWVSWIVDGLQNTIIKKWFYTIIKPLTQKKVTHYLRYWCQKDQG